MEVADRMAIWIMYFGIPQILQCNNGKEFKSALLILLKRYRIKIINGRPRTPRTQRLVEQTNLTVKINYESDKKLEAAVYGLLV